MATGRRFCAAANLVDDEPFVFCFGDDLVKSKISFTKQMVDDFEKHGEMILGVQEVALEDVVRYGIVKLKKGTMEIEDIIEKPTVKGTPSRFAEFGRMILKPEIIEVLKKTALGKGNELWLVDAIRTYIKKGGRVFAKEVQGGEWLTTGDPLNYLKAILKYALERQDLKDDLKSFIAENYK